MMSCPRFAGTPKFWAESLRGRACGPIPAEAGTPTSEFGMIGNFFAVKILQTNLGQTNFLKGIRLPKIRLRFFPMPGSPPSANFQPLEIFAGGGVNRRRACGVELFCDDRRARQSFSEGGRVDRRIIDEIGQHEVRNAPNSPADRHGAGRRRRN